MDRSLHRVVSSHILRFAIAMRAFTSLEQSSSDDFKGTKIFEMFYFFNWAVVYSYDNVSWHISDGHEFRLLTFSFRSLCTPAILTLSSSCCISIGDCTMSDVSSA